MTYPKLCYQEIQVSPKITVLHFGTLPQTPDSKNFVTVSRQCGQQKSLTVEHVDYTYDSRVHCGWMHKVYYTLVDCNPPSITLTCSGFLVQLVPRLSSSSWQNFDRVTASHLLKRQIKTGKRLLNLDPDYFAKILYQFSVTRLSKIHYDFLTIAIHQTMQLDQQTLPGTQTAYTSNVSIST